ncbi:MAG: GntR family transcriptional regulator [Tannerellaceae bacterium]|nr:GntR family transcriptional regulator [Tannerellaceae bacterium]
MLEIGKYHTLKIVKNVDFGLYLDAGDGLEILLPTRYVLPDMKPGNDVNVFIYHDNEGRPIATTLQPKAIVGEFRFMEVKSANQTGAFLDWGIMKDLLVPFHEQKTPMQEGCRYLVYVHIDHVTGRVVASARIDKYLGNVLPAYTKGEEVNILIADKTDMGYKVIINNLHWGLVYENEVFRSPEKGELLKGYIKNVRDDDKIDVSLVPLGYRKVEGTAGRVLESLGIHGGFLAVHDKSDPEEIYALFGCSKKAFKQAIGALYKQGLIRIEKNGIRHMPSR